MGASLLTAGADTATRRDHEVDDEVPPGPVAPRLGATGLRLRDLDRTGRWAAALLAAALLLAPVLAVAHFLPEWAPATDNAFIALRAYDVGGEGTPMTGQPSFSRYYGGDDRAHVDHLGAWAFYGLAPFVRVLGLSAGMLAFTALVSGSVSLLVPWVVFRRLGPRAAVVAAVVTALVVFTRGPGSLTNPLSSVFSGYPAFLAAVLVWALLCGDDRLLPLAVGVMSFAVQMHLAVGLMGAVLAVAAVAGVATNWRCGGGVTRARRRLLAGAALVGGVLWLPVVVQQLFGRYPNLSALVEFGSDQDRAAQGGARAVEHVANVLGWPPLLGQTDFEAFTSLYAEPAAVTWVTAALVLVAVAAAGVHWARRSRESGGEAAGAAPRALLAVMVGVLALAGYLNSGNIPTSAEAFRGEFYHWVWPLSFFTTLTLALAAADVVGALRAVPGPGRRARAVPGCVLPAAGIVVVAALAVAGVTLDRDAHALQAMQAELPRDAYETLADGIAAHRDELTGPVLLRSEGQLAIGLHHSALAAQLEERGIPVVLPLDNLNYVADQRLADPATVETVLVLVVESLVWHPAPAELDVPGEEIARFEVGDRPAAALAYDELVAVLEDADRIVVGDELARRSDEAAKGLGGLTPEALRDHAREVLVDVGLLALLREEPLVAPRLDPDALATLHAALADADDDAVVNTTTTTALRVLLVTGDDVDTYLHRDQDTT
jgi:hypothetical protein